MLTIRDDEVRTLARDLMRKTDAPSMTAAILQALKGEISRIDQQKTLREKIEALQERARGLATQPPDRNYVDSRDDMWRE